MSEQQELAERLGPFLDRCEFPEPGSNAVCAVSGGPDSMALLVLAVAAGLSVEAVHVDHGLRAGSDTEAEIVATAAARFGADFRSERVQIGSGGDVEARARDARRSVLGPDALTGHTADDQAETLLINLLRGSGVHGLAAMTGGGIHPILGLRRSDTHRICRQLDLSVISDPTNDDPRFVRNRVRHELLPLMADISDRDIVPLLNRTSDQARMMVSQINDDSSALDPADSRMLASAPPLLAAVALRHWLRNDAGHPPSSAELERVMAVVRHEATSCELSGGRKLRRTDGRLRIE